jgi:hypothetical protein
MRQRIALIANQRWRNTLDAVARSASIGEPDQADASRPVLSAKINPFALHPNRTYNSRRPCPQRGAYHDRHGRWAWDAVDAAASGAQRNGRAGWRKACELSTVRRRTALKRTAKPCGPDTRCWCQVGGGASARPGLDNPYSPTTVTKRIRRRGEHDISRKAIAQGMPDCSVCTCMLVCVSLCIFCTRDRGCSAHPAFPAPSVYEEGPNSVKASGASRRGNADSYLCRKAVAARTPAQESLWNPYAVLDLPDLELPRRTCHL